MLSWTSGYLAGLRLGIHYHEILTVMPHSPSHGLLSKTIPHAVQVLNGRNWYAIWPPSPVNRLQALQRSVRTKPVSAFKFSHVASLWKPGLPGALANTFRCHRQPHTVPPLPFACDLYRSTDLYFTRTPCRRPPSGLQHCGYQAFPYKAKFATTRVRANNTST